MTIPPYLYRGFTKEIYAKEFLEKGKFRLGFIEHYRSIEDDNRRDETEGKSESIVKQEPDFTLYSRGTWGDPVYLFCTSGPDVDLEYMKTKWPFVVKITDPEKLKNAIDDNKPLNTKMEVVGRCEIREVSYDKGELTTVDRNSVKEAIRSYTQKPRSFEEDCEFRYVVKAFTANHEPDCYLYYNLGYKIDYASFA